MRNILLLLVLLTSICVKAQTTYKAQTVCRGEIINHQIEWGKTYPCGQKIVTTPDAIMISFRDDIIVYKVLSTQNATNGTATEGGSLELLCIDEAHNKEVKIILYEENAVSAVMEMWVKVDQMITRYQL
jgi:hypothetical protein